MRRPHPGGRCVTSRAGSISITARWTLCSDVRITAEGRSLGSDKAIVSFRNKRISAATITGSPAQFEQKREDGTLRAAAPTPSTTTLRAVP